MTSSDDGDIVLVYDDLVVVYSDGATETLALPKVNSHPTCISMLWTEKNRFVIGYESGEMLIFGLDTETPSSFQFHSTPLIEFVVKEKSIWCLHTNGALVRIYDLDVLLTSDALSYGCVQKYQLVGDVKSVEIIGSGQIVAVGSSPMIQHLKDLTRWDGDIIADELDAMRIRAKHAASQMATSLTGFAKGMWSRNASTDSLRSVGSPKARSALINKRLIRVTPDVTMNEPDRTISVAVGSPDGKCAMVADAFNGRIFLFHLGAGLFTRLWKGYRGAQFHFLDNRTAVIVAPRQLFLELRDTVEDARLAVVQLSEALPGRTEFRLLSRDILATCTPSGLEFHKLSAA